MRPCYACFFHSLHEHSTLDMHDGPATAPTFSSSGERCVVRTGACGSASSLALGGGSGDTGSPLHSSVRKRRLSSSPARSRSTADPGSGTVTVLVTLIAAADRSALSPGLSTGPPGPGRGPDVWGPACAAERCRSYRCRRSRPEDVLDRADRAASDKPVLGRWYRWDEPPAASQVSQMPRGRTKALVSYKRNQLSLVFLRVQD